MLEFLKAPLDEKRRACLKKHPLTLHKRKDGGKKRKKRRPEYCPEATRAMQEAVIQVGEAISKLGKEQLPAEYFEGY